MVVCRLFMCTIMGWIPAESIASSTVGYPHSLPAPCFAVITMIHGAACWQNSVRTLRISSVTTQLLLPQSNTDSTNALYISPWDRTVTLVFSRTLPITPHHLQDLRKLRYTAAQLLLLYAIVRTKYGNSSVGAQVLTLIWNNTLLALK